MLSVNEVFDSSSDNEYTQTEKCTTPTKCHNSGKVSSCLKQKSNFQKQNFQRSYYDEGNPERQHKVHFSDDNPTSDKAYLYNSGKPGIQSSSFLADMKKMDVGRSKMEMNDRRSSFDYHNICNNNTGPVGGISSTAAYIKQDIVSRQRMEILRLMEELGARDGELNDLVRSHQAQVKSWEADRSKLKELHEKLKDYEKDLYESDLQLQTTVAKMQQVSKQKEMGGKELQKTKEEMEKLAHQIKENSLYLKQMEGQNKTLLDSVNNLVNVKKDLESKGKDLCSQLKSKRSELNLQTSEMNRLMEENKKLVNKLEDADEAIRNLKAETKAWKNRYCIARDDSDKVTEDNKKKEEQVQSLTSQLHETVQETLALQKALFSSCEREKCQERLLESARKQHKRSMQELSTMRKLYERQSKDLTLYHLSVQDSKSSSHQLSVEKEAEETPAQVKGHDQGQEKPSERQSKKEEARPSQNYRPNNRNMSYHRDSQPNFLKFDSGNRSASFLVKRRLNCAGNEVDVKGGENADDKGSREPRLSEDKDKTVDDCRKKGYPDSIVSRKRKNPGKCVPEVGVKDVVACKNGNNEGRKHDSRSVVSSSSEEDFFNKSFHRKQGLRCRSTSPAFCVKDAGTSPIPELMVTTHCTGTGHLASSFNNNKAKESSSLPTPTCWDENRKEKVPAGDIPKDGNDPHRHRHNETSGVYLSSSECSSVSTVEPEKGYEELTPADSDGMCRELKGDFPPNGDVTPHTCHEDRTLQNPTTIHLGTSPTFLPLHPQTSSTPSNKRPEGDKDTESWATYNVPDVNRKEVELDGPHSTSQEKHKVLRSLCHSKKFLEQGVSRSSDVGVGKNNTNDYLRNNCNNKNMSDVQLHDIHTELEDANTYSLPADFAQRLDNSKRSGILSARTHPQSKFKRCYNRSIKKVNSGESLRDSSDDIDSLNTSESGIGSRLSGRDQSDFPSCFSQRGTSITQDVSGLDRDNSSFQHCKSLMRHKEAAAYSKQERTPSPRQTDNWRKKLLSLSRRLKDDSTQSSDSDILQTDAENPAEMIYHPKQPNELSRKPGSSYHSYKMLLNDNSAKDRETNGRHLSEENNDEKHTVKQEYFYDESVGSLTENFSSKMTNRQDETKSAQNAYIVPLTNSSHTFPSVKAPSLYKHLSRVHFSEKSGLYELVNSENVQNSDERNIQSLMKKVSNEKPSELYRDRDTANEKYSSSRGRVRNANNNFSQEFCVGTTTVDSKCFRNDNKESLISSPVCNKIETDLLKRENSDNDTANMNTNNSCGSHFFFPDQMVQRIDCQVSPVVVDSLMLEQNPAITMDKFHHHFYNIVKKLNISGASPINESATENGELSNHWQDIEKAPKKRIKNNQCLDQNSKFNPTQDTNASLFSFIDTDSSKQSVDISCVTGCSVVKKLNFSESFAVSDIASEGTGLVLPFSESRNWLRDVKAAKDVNATKTEMNNESLPDEQYVDNHSFTPYEDAGICENGSVCENMCQQEERNTKILSSMNYQTAVLSSDAQPLLSTSDELPLSSNAQSSPIFNSHSPLQSAAQPLLSCDIQTVWNICPQQRTVPTLSNVGQTFASSDDENVDEDDNIEYSNSSRHAACNVEKNLGEFVTVTSLPDYFPDISSVIADDDDSVVGEDQKHVGFVGDKDRKEVEDVTLDTCEDSLDATPNCAKPYSQTSTPTKPASTSLEVTNDLNVPPRRRDLPHKEERLVSKLSDVDEMFSAVNEMHDKISDDWFTDVNNILCRKKSESTKISDLIKIPQSNRSTEMCDQRTDSIDVKKKNHRKPAECNESLLWEESEHTQQENDHKPLIIPMSQPTNITSPSGPSKSVCSNSTHVSSAVEFYNAHNTPIISATRELCSMQRSQSTFDGRLLVYLEESCEDQTLDLSVEFVPMSPASKLHHLLVESQAMLQCLKKGSAKSK